MAAKTVWSCEAGDGAFKVTFTYDDVTLLCSTVNYDLLSGVAKVKFSEGQQVTLPAGVGRTVPFPGSKLLSASPLGLGFVWSPG